ncbi:MAG: YbdD/YjiX family protein [Methylococcaceae bacterium]|nr:YbdD/YjiX family protein [Methylococcaceae bacterium]
MLSQLKVFWRGLRRLSGDDAYERYLEHRASGHANIGTHPLGEALSRAEFFKQRLEHKWAGVKRCC